MKKFLFSFVALFLFLSSGMNKAMAQTSFENLDPKLQALAQTVVDNNLTDIDKANKAFENILKKAKKTSDQLTLAKYFLDNEIYPCANQCAEMAYKNDPENVDVLMLQGEIYMFGRSYGKAGQKFDQILEKDPNNIYALRNSARVYKRINPHAAMDYLKRIKEIEPNNFEADKNMGDIAYELSEYTNAVAYYDSYYKNVPKTADEIDLRSCENYLQSLYAVAAADGSKSDEYAAKMVEVVETVQPFETDNLVFKRMRFFANMAQYNSVPTSSALKTAQNSASYILNNEHVDSLYLFLDYLNIANLMSEMEQYDSAVVYMRRAVKLNPEKPEGYKILADNLAKANQSDEALTVYSTYLEKLGDNARNADILRLARMYGAAAVKAFKAGDTARQNELVQKIDETIDRVEKLNPGNVGIASQRARLHIMDGSVPQDDVKTLYEEVLSRAAGKDGMTDYEIEAYKYLLFYAIQKDDLDAARKSCDELLKRDPEDSLGKKADGYLKGQGK